MRESYVELLQKESQGKSADFLAGAIGIQTHELRGYMNGVAQKAEIVRKVSAYFGHYDLSQLQPEAPAPVFQRHGMMIGIDERQGFVITAELSRAMGDQFLILRHPDAPGLLFMKACGPDTPNAFTLNKSRRVNGSIDLCRDLVHRCGWKSGVRYPAEELEDGLLEFSTKRSVATMHSGRQPIETTKGKK